MQTLAFLNSLEMALVFLIALALVTCGKVAGWDRIIIKDRYALLMIGALVGVVLVVRVLL
jgi:hypothetical protein